MPKGRFMFVLPQLPKADYMLLQDLSKGHQATQLEVLMAALRQFSLLVPHVRQGSIDQWRTTEAVHNAPAPRSEDDAASL